MRLAQTPLVFFRLNGAWLKTVFFVTTILCGLVCRAQNEVVSIEHRRLMIGLQPFLGSYVQTNALGEESEVILVVHDNHLEYIESVGNIVIKSLRIDMKDLGQYRKTWTGSSKGPMLVETDSQLSEGFFGLTQTLSTKLWRSEELKTIRVVPHGLLYTHTRKYFKRRYGIFGGDWVPNTTSFDGSMNSVDKQRVLLKLSSSAMPVDEFYSMIRSRTDQYQQALSHSASTLEQKPEKKSEQKFEKGVYRISPDEYLKSKNEKAHSDERKVIPFRSPRKKNCETDLQD